MDWSSLAAKAMSSMGSSGGGSGAGGTATKIYQKIRGVGQGMAKAAPNVANQGVGGNQVNKSSYVNFDVTDMDKQTSGNADVKTTENTIGNTDSGTAQETKDISPVASDKSTNRQSSTTEGTPIPMPKTVQSTSKENISSDDIKKQFEPDSDTIKDKTSLDSIKTTPVDASTQNNIDSDVRIKDRISKCAGMNPTDCMSKINAYIFKYKKGAQKAMSGQNGMDDNTHFGVMAQELEDNPATLGVVETNKDGVKTLNVGHLTAANTAAISDMAKRIQHIEDMLKESK